MSSAAWNIFGVVASALGIIGVFPLCCLVITCQLPIQKSNTLEDMLSETKNYFVSVVEDGLMTDWNFVQKLGLELDGYQERASELKIEARYDDGYLYQLKCMLLGLSCQIHATYRKVRNVHSKIKRIAYENKHKRRTGVRSILPALRRASTGVVDDAEDKLDDDTDSSQEAQEASQNESNISHDTRALRTNDGEAVPGSTASTAAQ